MPATDIDDDLMPSEMDEIMPSQRLPSLPSITIPSKFKLSPDLGVHLPSQSSSGFFGPPSSQDADDWSFTSALAEPGKQEPMAQHVFDFGKNLATLSVTTPAAVACEVAEKPAAALMNVDPGLALLRQLLGAKPFQPGEPIIPAPTGPGVLPAIGRTVSGLTTPGNLLMLGLAPGTKLLQEMFLAGAVGSVPDSLERMATAKDSGELTDAATQLGLNIGMAALMKRGLSKERPTPPGDNEDLMPSAGDTFLPSVRNENPASAKSTGVPEKIDNLADAVKGLQEMLRGRLSAQEQQTVNVPTEKADEVRRVFPAEEQPVSDTAPKLQRRSSVTRLGIKRRNLTEWRATRDLWDQVGYGDILSDANRDAIARGRTPTVDEAWIIYFPEDAGLFGEQIRMHHIGGSPVTVPLPATRHLDGHMPGGFRYNSGGPGSTLPAYPALGPKTR